MEDYEAYEQTLNGVNKMNTKEIRAALSKLDIPPLNEDDSGLLAQGCPSSSTCSWSMLPGKDRVRSWMNMFLEVDRTTVVITFNELERMVRDQLKPTTKELPLAAAGTVVLD